MRSFIHGAVATLARSIRDFTILIYVLFAINVWTFDKGVSIALFTTLSLATLATFSGLRLFRSARGLTAAEYKERYPFVNQLTRQFYVFMIPVSVFTLVAFIMVAYTTDTYTKLELRDYIVDQLDTTTEEAAMPAAFIKSLPTYVATDLFYTHNVANRLDEIQQDLIYQKYAGEPDVVLEETTAEVIRLRDSVIAVRKRCQMRRVLTLTLFFLFELTRFPAQTSLKYTSLKRKEAEAT